MLMIIGGCLIGLITALVGYPVVNENGLQIKNLLIVISCTALWVILITTLEE